MANDQRKKQFVDAAVQGALCRRLVLHWCAFLLTGLACALLIQALSDPFLPWSDHIQKAWRTQGPFLLVAICLIPIFVLDTVKLSHRFAGPLFRIRGQLRNAARGERAQPVTLRPGDFWQDFALEFNALLARLNALEAQRDRTGNPPSERQHELVTS